MSVRRYTRPIIPSDLVGSGFVGRAQPGESPIFAACRPNPGIATWSDERVRMELVQIACDNVVANVSIDTACRAEYSFIGKATFLVPIEL
jgi:hypothetical protein